MSWFTGGARRHEAEKLAALDRSLAIIEFAPDGTILAANENFGAALGYAPAELVGKRHSQFVEPEEAQGEAYGAFWRKLSSGQFDSGVYKRRRKDGSPCYIQATYNPVKGADGRVVSVLKVAADVTKAQIAALENQAKMQALAMVQGVIEFRPDGEILDANDLFLKTTGYARAEVVGRHHSLFVDPAYAGSPAYREFWRRLNAGEHIVDSYHRIGKNGRRIWLQASYSPIFDLDGNVYKVVKFAYDITDLLRLGEGLARLARNDVGERLDAPFVSTFDKLRVDFNTALDNLNAVLRSLAASVGAVNASAGEIAGASRDLSQRTEAQAASLEETAAAVGQVTTTVKKATQSAQLANQVVRAARSDAEKSGEIVGSAVEAMGRLERSSQEIGNIIGVIDEIAFQTNLLALNAGVEAARAGDAGRGFAVVASEVRALAQRSAEAARQIKTLIAASGADVASGVKLVRETGAALGGIVAKVMEINTLVGAIADAAQEQSGALGEVNAAVGQMDQATQQNAAMAEQANASAQAMAEQIAALEQAIGAFRLAETGGAQRRRAA